MPNLTAGMTARIILVEASQIGPAAHPEFPVVTTTLGNSSS